MNKSNYHLDRYVNKLSSILGRPTCPVICKQCAVWNLKISIFNMFLNPVTKFLNQRQAVKFMLQERKYLRHLKVLTESLKSSSRSFLCMLTNMLTLSSNPSKAQYFIQSILYTFQYLLLKNISYLYNYLICGATGVRYRNSRMQI